MKKPKDYSTLPTRKLKAFIRIRVKRVERLKGSCASALSLSVLEEIERLERQLKTLSDELMEREIFKTDSAETHNS